MKVISFILITIILLLFCFSFSHAMVPQQLKNACSKHIDETIKNCEALSDLCCDSKLKNVKDEGDQKQAMANYYRDNKESLLEEMIISSDVDCHKEYEVRAFLIRKFFGRPD